MDARQEKYFNLLHDPRGYVASSCYVSQELQNKNKDLVWRYNNQVLPSQKAKQIALLEEILGDRGQAMIEPPFHCDYGFNIRFAGRAFVNYNAVFLDTSPINIGKNVLIGPNAIFSCAGHSLFPEERM